MTTDKFIQDNEKVQAKYSLKKTNSGTSLRSGGGPRNSAGKRPSLSYSVRNGVGDRLELLYRVESYETYDKKKFQRQKVKILIFFVVDLIVLTVCVTSLAMVYE